MQLIKLYANQSSFKTIEFKPGLNLILGKMVSKNEQKTYNGVGKTLLLRLIHFCLGSSKDEELEKALPGWSFTLEFSIDGIPYTVTRFTESQEKVTFGNYEISLNEFTKIMGEKLFHLEKRIKWLTFRNLVKRFLRVRREGYNRFDVADEADIKQPMNSEICNAYLLGLDVVRIQEKANIIKQVKNIRNKEKNIKDDDVVKEFLSDGTPKKVKRFHLVKQIEELEGRIKNIDIAENHNELVQDADSLSSQMYELENKFGNIEEKIKKIDQLLSIKSQVNSTDIVNIYNEAKDKFGDLIKDDLLQIEKFHNEIMTKRQERLLSERDSLAEQRKVFKKEIKRVGEARDAKLKLLSNKGALDELNSITQQLGALKGALEKLDSYEKLLESYSLKLIDFQQDFISENEKTKESLAAREILIDEKLRLFSSLAEQFYGKRVVSGIEILEDEGENSRRYKIDAIIESDSSDGINQVKIFCYDLMLLLSSHNNKMQCLFHDSRIFGDMDHRQIATLFKIVNEKIKGNYQYIATINNDKLILLKERLGEERYKAIIENNIIKELSDESVSTKLLGINVSLKDV